LLFHLGAHRLEGLVNLGAHDAHGCFVFHNPNVKVVSLRGDAALVLREVIGMMGRARPVEEIGRLHYACHG
jgi:hypothetical protein